MADDDRGQSVRISPAHHAAHHFRRKAPCDEEAHLPGSLRWIGRRRPAVLALPDGAGALQLGLAQPLRCFGIELDAMARQLLADAGCALALRPRMDAAF